MTLAIRLSPDMEYRLNRLSEKTGRTKAYYVRKAIAAFLEDWEDHQLGLMALEVMKDPNAKYYTMEEVERELGLERPVGKKSVKKPGKARARRTKTDSRVHL